MNTLSVDVSNDNGLSFELLVDGKPMGEVLGDGNEGIPFWIVKHGLPTYPPTGESADSLIHIVSVCGCGEYGCGHSRCTIIQRESTVEFSGFEGDVGTKGAALRFEFPLSQYKAVCELISEKTHEHLSAEG